MKAMLIKNSPCIWHYRDGVKISGVHESLSGDVSGLSGDVSGLRGDVDKCEITEEERMLGVNIAQLIKLAEPT